MTIRVMLKHLQSMSIEPVYFLYYTTFILLDQVNMNLFLQKACRFNATVEPDLNTPCDNERQGILFASHINSNYRYIMFTLCIFYTILATCWSDEVGRRKPLIVLPILGQILQAINGCLHSYFWYWPPMAAVFSEIFFEIFSGGVTLFLCAAQIYICDISNAENRTMRVGLLMGVKTLCMPIGYGSAGFLIRGLGFFYSYLLCLVLSAISCVLGFVLLKDAPVDKDKKCGFLQLFNIMRVVESFRIVFKSTLGNKRIVISLLLILYVSMYFTVQGEKTVFYLFLRYKFHWDEKQFSLYLIYRQCGVILGTIFCSIILSKWLNIHDGLIGAIAGCLDTIAVLGYLFASENWHLYIVPLFDIFHGTAFSISISFLSKFYKRNEFGRVNAILYVFSLMIPFSHPVYNIVFQKTLDFFPSAFFIISIVLNFIVCVLYCFSYILCRIMKI